MYRTLFVAYGLVACGGLLVCLLNWLDSFQTFRRQTDELTVDAALRRLIVHSGVAYVCLLLILLVLAVLAWSNPGDGPRTPTGWVLYGVLWSVLGVCVGISVDQRRFVQRVRRGDDSGAA